MCNDPFSQQEYDLTKKDSLIKFIKDYVQFKMDFVGTNTAKEDAENNPENLKLYITQYKELFRQEIEEAILKQVDKAVPAESATQIKKWIEDFERKQTDKFNKKDTGFKLSAEQEKQIIAQARGIVDALIAYTNVREKINTKDLLDQLVRNRKAYLVKELSGSLTTTDDKNNHINNLRRHSWPF